MNKDELKAKEKVAEYKEQKRKPEPLPEAPNNETQAASTVPRSEMAWNDLISHRIEEANRNGAFDNLRGKGKPLLIERNPFVPAEQQMANDLLKNNNLAPHWISERTAMLETIERFRQRFRTTAHHFHQLWQATPDVKTRQRLDESWQRQLSEWGEEIKELNRRITTINLQQPIARLEIFKVLLDEELTRAGVKRALS